MFSRNLSLQWGNSKKCWTACLSERANSNMLLHDFPPRVRTYHFTFPVYRKFHIIFTQQIFWRWKIDVRIGSERKEPVFFSQTILKLLRGCDKQSGAQQSMLQVAPWTVVAFKDTFRVAQRPKKLQETVDPMLSEMEWQNAWFVPTILSYFHKMQTNHYVGFVLCFQTFTKLSFW